jgi:hypothetical protein
MTTSGVYVVTKTGTTFCTEVLKAMGKLGIGTTAPAEDLEEIRSRANSWLMLQNGPNNKYRVGNMMWTRETATLTLGTTTNLYELKPSGGDLDIQIPSQIFSVQYRETDNDTDTPMVLMTQREKDEIADKDQSGTPSKYYYEKRVDVGYLYFNYVSAEAAEAIINYQQPVEIINALANTLDIDPSWYEAMLWNVALFSAPFFEIHAGTPKYTTIAAMAQATMDIINSFFPDNEPIGMRP